MMDFDPHQLNSDHLMFGRRMSLPSVYSPIPAMHLRQPGFVAGPGILQQAVTPLNLSPLPRPLSPYILNSWNDFSNPSSMPQSPVNGGRRICSGCAPVHLQKFQSSWVPGKQPDVNFSVSQKTEGAFPRVYSPIPFHADARTPSPIVLKLNSERSVHYPLLNESSKSSRNISNGLNESDNLSKNTMQIAGPPQHRRLLQVKHGHSSFSPSHSPTFREIGHNQNSISSPNSTPPPILSQKNQVSFNQLGRNPLAPNLKNSLMFSTMNSHIQMDGKPEEVISSADSDLESPILHSDSYYSKEYGESPHRSSMKDRDSLRTIKRTRKRTASRNDLSFCGMYGDPNTSEKLKRRKLFSSEGDEKCEVENECSASGPTKDESNSHENESSTMVRVWVDDKYRPFYDCSCGKRKPMQDLKRILKHVETHNVTGYPCNLCGRVFAHHLGRNSHQKVHKQDEILLP